MNYKHYRRGEHPNTPLKKIDGTGKNEESQSNVARDWGYDVGEQTGKEVAQLIHDKEVLLGRSLMPEEKNELLRNEGTDALKKNIIKGVEKLFDGLNPNEDK